MDMITKIHEALIADEYIQEQTKYVDRGVTLYRIKFYEYPESGNVAGPIVIIDPLGPPLDSEYGDNEPIVEEYLYQVDVWTKDHAVTKNLARRVQKVLRSIGFRYYAGGIDEYDAPSKIYRDARRVRGKIYTEEFKTLN